MSRPDIAIAFDVGSLDEALALEERLGPGDEWAKIGLELFTAAGPEAVRVLRERGRRVFLDLKLHDIPSTVERSARAAATLGAELVTVHAWGGAPVVAAAVAGARAGNAATRVVAVTLLTSLNQYNLPPGVAQPFFFDLVAAQLTRMALATGAAGVVCSVAELPWMRRTVREPFFAVTPGIRGVGEAAHDQSRAAGVTQAVGAGADLLVVGRPVTRASDSRAALERLRSERDAAWEGRQAVPAG